MLYVGYGNEANLGTPISFIEHCNADMVSCHHVQIPVSIDLEFSSKLIPNPFSFSAILSNKIKEPSMVHFNIYNQLGKLVL
jgi:hypothetical protein